MFNLFIVSLSFSISLAIKCLFLNDEPCMVRPSLIELNPVELNYDPFMISLNKCTGSRNVLSPKICVPKETKDINGKAFTMIRNKSEAKTMTENIFHVIVNANSMVQYVIQIINGIIKHVNVNVKVIVDAKNVIVESKPGA